MNNSSIISKVQTLTNQDSLIKISSLAKAYLSQSQGSML